MFKPNYFYEYFNGYYLNNEKYSKECSNKIFKKISDLFKIICRLENESGTTNSVMANSSSSIYEQPEQFCHFRRN
jgi:hypothetical protein